MLREKGLQFDDENAISARTPEKLPVGVVSEGDMSDFEKLANEPDDVIFGKVRDPLPEVDAKLLDGKNGAEKMRSLVSIYEGASRTARSEGRVDEANRYAKFAIWAKSGMSAKEVAQKEK